MDCNYRTESKRNFDLAKEFVEKKDYVTGYLMYYHGISNAIKAKLEAQQSTLLEVYSELQPNKLYSEVKDLDEDLLFELNGVKSPSKIYSGDYQIDTSDIADIQRIKERLLVVLGYSG